MKNQKCSMQVLQKAIDGNLSLEAEQELNRHLGVCDHCSAALDEIAGGADFLSEAALNLVEDWLDEEIPTREVLSDVDFAVTHLEPSNASEVLGCLGGYDVLGIIGRGGMGVVLKAFDPELKRCVAIKTLAPHLAQSAIAKKRFAREAQAAAAIVHPNVLAIHHVQPNGPLPFLVMPLVTGESLAQRLRNEGSLELVETLRIGMQAAAGLAAAHEQGLVHRDIKPSNILLEKGVERVVITDFGLVRAADDVAMTHSGLIVGTPQYMSPEQARGEPLDGRSDLFSLGCVIYEMATGDSPFRADTMIATLRRLVDDPHHSAGSRNPSLPPWFICIVDRLLEKDRSKRFGSAKDVTELLEGCLAHLQQPANHSLPALLSPSVSPRSAFPYKPLSKGKLIMLASPFIALLALVMLMQISSPQPSSTQESESSAKVNQAQKAPIGETAHVIPTDNGVLQMENMKGVLSALQAYNKKFGNYPPAIILDSESKMERSWRVELLPFMGQTTLYDQYKKDESWDSIANQQILKNMPRVYRHPSQPVDSTVTAIIAAYGNGLFFEPSEPNRVASNELLPTSQSRAFNGTSISDVKDNANETVAILEMKTDIPWTKPEDIVFDVAKKQFPDLGFDTICFHVGLASGDVWKVHKAITSERLKGLLTIAGNETLSNEKFLMEASATIVAGGTAGSSPKDGALIQIRSGGSAGTKSDDPTQILIPDGQSRPAITKESTLELEPAHGKSKDARPEDSGQKKPAADGSANWKPDVHKRYSMRGLPGKANTEKPGQRP